MHKRRWQCLFAVACLALLVAPVARGQTTLQKHVIASGATLSADQGGNVAMVGTIGQVVIGRSSSSTHTGAFGFWYTFPTDPTNSVEENYSGGVTGVSASLNVAPNPVTDFAEVRINLPTNGHVSLKIYDAVGREHQTLIDDRREAGTITVRLTTETLASGNYTVVLVANGAQRTTALRVIK
jgi:hypothetical protein